MTASTARESHPSLGQDEPEPLSLVRLRSKPVRRFQVEPRSEAFRSTLADPTMLALRRNAALPEALDAWLEAGFGDAILATGAHVGLLHRRGDAFFYTIAVRGLDQGMHMMVWVSMWDAAIQRSLQGKTLVGASQTSAEHAVVARRLRGANDPSSIVAVPVTIGDSVEAVVELGRFGRGFCPQADRRALEAMLNVVQGVAVTPTGCDNWLRMSRGVPTGAGEPHRR